MVAPPRRNVAGGIAWNAQHILIFLLPPLLVLVLALCFRQGMRASDDLDYAHLAYALIHPDQAVMAARSHHVARLGMTVPLACVFSVLGIANWSLTLLPFLSTVLAAPLIALLAHRLFGRGAAVLSGCLYALFPLTVDLANLYVPEPFVVLELTVASLLFLSAIEREGKTAHCLEVMSGILIGIAYLTTEAALLMIVVFAAHLGIKNRVHSRHLWVLVGCAVVVGVEFAYQAAVHGNPLYRLTLTEDYMIGDAMVRAANLDLADRLLKAYPRLFVYPNLDYGAFGPLLLISGAYGVYKFRECSFLVVWAAVFLCFYNFMSASFTQYVALPVAPRLTALGCLPLLILAGKLGADAWHGARRVAHPAVRASLCMVIAAVAGGLAVVSIVCLFLGTNISLRAVLARNAEAAADYLRDVPSVLLLSDARSAKAMQFLRQFNGRDAYVSFERAHALTLDAASDSGREVFVLLNGPVLYEKDIAGFQYHRTPSRISNADLSPFQPSRHTPVFSTRFEKGPLFRALLTYDWAQGILGGYGYRVAKNLFTADPRFAQVHVFRYHPAVKHDGSPATHHDSPASEIPFTTEDVQVLQQDGRP